MCAAGPQIDVEPAGRGVRRAASEPHRERPLREVARNTNAPALETRRCDGDRRRAAEALRISATTLKRRLRAPGVLDGRCTDSDGSAS
jgi:DNA-binding NtrC family response regulator